MARRATSAEIVAALDVMTVAGEAEVQRGSTGRGCAAAGAKALAGL